MELLSGLNSAQKKAVTHEKGPLLIVAGAGTGKTTVLIKRLSYLVLEKKASTEEVLLLTFTEKAAGEMEERADLVLPYGYIDLWISTFHGFGERLLREHALDIGLSADFRVLTETDQWVLVKKNLARFALDYYRPLGNPTKFISELLKHFSRLKDENISPAEYLKYVEDLESDLDERLSGKKLSPKAKVKKTKILNETEAEKGGEELELGRLRELANAYHVYNQLLLENNYLDFGDLIIYLLKLFRDRPNILRYYREKFKHIMIDEFQDTNWAQYELIKLLAAPKNNLVVVGDDDQAIYKFRGASLSNILQFKDDFSGCQEIVLTENYRSRQEILDRAYEFIQNNNPARLEKKLKIDKRLLAQTYSEEKPARETKKTAVAVVRFFNFSTVAEEVDFVVQTIKSIYAKAGEAASWSDFAILVRANDTADFYVKELGRQDVPNQFMSWRGLYYKPLILDILAYLRLLDNYHESTALYRVLNMAPFRVAHQDLVNINKVAGRKLWSLYEALKNIEAIPGISAASVKNIHKLLDLIARHSVLVASQKPTKIFLHFAYDSGLIENLDHDRDLELFSYLNQFYQKLKKLEEAEPDLRLPDFLSAINLELEAGETGALKLDFADSEAVKIMTVHGAKGLEFKYVFLVNLVDKKFPTIARGEKIPLPDSLVREKITTGPDIHLAEERRLFYVALTRAKEALYLSGAKDYGGVREKKPSRFIKELGLIDSAPEVVIDLNRKNEFLRDLRRLNEQELSVAPQETYPLPEKFSFSQLAAFATCPLQYKFAFILKIPAPSDKASLIFGRILHNTLYNFLLPLVNRQRQADLFGENTELDAAGLINEKRLLSLYQEFWQADGYQSPEEREAYRLKGREVLKKFWQDYQTSSGAQIMFLEKKFSFRVGGEIIKGTIDRVDQLADGRLEVIDYKTGKKKDRLEFADKRQLILYQLFLEEFLRLKVASLSYYYLESGEKVSFTASEKDIDRLRLEITQEISAIKQRNFSPRPGLMCDFCDFNRICEFRQK